MLNIAIIDDDIGYGENNFRYTINMENNLIYKIEGDFSSNAGYNGNHGKICAKILKDYLSGYRYNLHGIKIINSETNASSVDSLIIALNWCLNNDINIINLSAGVTSYKDFTAISKVIDKLLNKNIMIVAAGNNNDTLTYPAAIQGVIGVKYDFENKLAPNTFLFLNNPIDGVEIICRTKYKTYASNSFAAPYITAIISTLMCNGINRNKDIIQRLKQMSTLEDYYNSKDYIIDSFIRYTSIEIPIICVIMSDDIENEYRVSSVVNRFRDRDYNCVGLVKLLQTNYLNGIINVDKYFKILDFNIEQLISAYSYLTDSDIIIVTLLESEVNHLRRIKQKELIDMIICLNNVSMTMSNLENINCHQIFLKETEDILNMIEERYNLL